jgi:hypothetical protein
VHCGTGRSPSRRCSFGIAMMCSSVCFLPSSSRSFSRPHSSSRRDK